MYEALAWMKDLSGTAEYNAIIAALLVANIFAWGILETIIWNSIVGPSLKKALIFAIN